jgi:hypothetical protein
MTNRADADFLQVLRREAWQDLFTNLVLAECGLVLPKTQAPQPDHNVHDGAYNRGWRTSSAGAASVSRVAMGVLRALQSTLRSNGNGRSLTFF